MVPAGLGRSPFFLGEKVVTQILANRRGGQMIFKTYIEASKKLQLPATKIKKAIRNGEPVIAGDGNSWFLDRLFTEDDIEK